MPETFTAGDTLKFTKAVSSDYPPATWALSYALVNANGKISFTATDNGDGSFLVTVADTVTASYEPGIYQYQGTVTDGSERFLVDSGTVEIEPNFAAASQFDAREHVEKVLDALEAVIENRATEADLSYSIGGRSISKMSLAELTEAYSFYKQQVRQVENARRIAKGLGNKNMILTRFN